MPIKCTLKDNPNNLSDESLSIFFWAQKKEQEYMELSTQSLGIKRRKFEVSKLKHA